MEKVKFYIECRKAKSGNKYVALFADTSYSTCLVTVDKKVVMELANITPAMYSSLSVGEKININTEGE